jgi:hypothetical protein
MEIVHQKEFMLTFVKLQGSNQQMCLLHLPTTSKKSVEKTILMRKINILSLCSAFSARKRSAERFVDVSLQA